MNFFFRLAKKTITKTKINILKTQLAFVQQQQHYGLPMRRKDNLNKKNPPQKRRTL